VFRVAVGRFNGLDVVFQCPNDKCQKAFIAEYIYMSRGGLVLRNLLPVEQRKEKFSELLEGISPNFVEIYNQALVAESEGLKLVAGMGFGKALEFLIKDFAISRHPDKEDEILRAFLGPCIDKYVDDPNVKECAKRAVWLRNDESHYLRCWEGKDINDLRVLIRLTVNWLENVLLTEKYVGEMGGSRQ
jgi:hypothetical protein